jgi:hypothetical protein
VHTSTIKAATITILNRPTFVTSARPLAQDDTTLCVPFVNDRDHHQSHFMFRPSITLRHRGVLRERRLIFRLHRS